MSGNISHDLLQQVFPPDDAYRVFQEKVKQRPLFLRPTDTEVADARELRRRERLRKSWYQRKKQKPKPLTAREKRALCIYEIPKEARKYSIYEPLHKLWVGYIQETLGSGPISAQTAAKLVSADFHGAELEVVRSRCVSRVGVKGIVVKETKFTFDLITKTDQLKTIPKEYSIFKFKVPQKALAEHDGPDLHQCPLVFELHGSQFKNRAPDRANRRFKQHISDDL